MNNTTAFIVMAGISAYAILIHGLSLALLQTVFGFHHVFTLGMAATFGVVRTLGSVITKSRAAEKWLGIRISNPLGNSFRYLGASLAMGLGALYITGAIVGFSVPFLVALPFTIVMFMIDRYLLG